MALPKDFQKEEGGSDLTSQYTMQHLKDDPSKVKVRVLTDFIQGKEVYGEKDGKVFPYRFRVGDKVPVTCIGTDKFTGMPNRIKGFLAAIVYNYTTDQVEILSTPSTDMKNSFFDLEQNEDWGDLKGYDITIARSGQKKETRYSVMPSNKGPFTKDAPINGIDLEALYTGENPFRDYVRPGMSAKSDNGESLVYSDVDPDEIPF